MVQAQNTLDNGFKHLTPHGSFPEIRSLLFRLTVLGLKISLSPPLTDWTEACSPRFSAPVGGTTTSGFSPRIFSTFDVGPSTPSAMLPWQPCPSVVNWPGSKRQEPIHHEIYQLYSCQALTQTLFHVLHQSVGRPVTRPLSSSSYYIPTYSYYYCTPTPTYTIILISGWKPH